MDLGMTHQKLSLFQGQRLILDNMTRQRDIALRPPFSNRSTVAVGTFVTKLIAFAATRGRKGRWDTTERHHRTNWALPRQVQRVKRCTATTQYCLLFLGLFPLRSEDKELSITASVCNLRIPLWANTIRSAFTLNSTQKLCQGTNFLLPSWIRISFIFLWTHS